MSVIGLFGLSGVGKSFFTEKLKNQSEIFMCVRASDLIKKAQGELSYKRLNSIKIENNQKILCQEFEKFRKINSTKKIVIELHNLIEKPDGYEIIEPSVFASLHLTDATFLHLNPAKILFQRTNDHSKKRPEATVNEIDFLQDISMKKFLTEFGPKSLILESDNPDNINAFINFFSEK
jgi:adenylate kinase